MKITKSRLVISIDRADEELARRASVLAGCPSLTEFVEQAICETAARIIADHDSYQLSQEDYEAFVTACNNAPAPTQALLDAQQRRQLRIRHGQLVQRRTEF